MNESKVPLPGRSLLMLSAISAAIAGFVCLVHPIAGCEVDTGEGARVNVTIGEVEVYGAANPSVNIALNAVVRECPDQSGLPGFLSEDGQPSHAVDGNGSTYWGSLNAKGSFLEIDLGSLHVVERFLAKGWLGGSDSGLRKYRITGASELEAGEFLLSESDDFLGGEILFEGNSHEARFLRLYLFGSTEREVPTFFSDGEIYAYKADWGRHNLYEVRNLYVSANGRGFFLRDGVVLEGTSSAGVVALTIMGEGEILSGETNIGEFDFLFLKINPIDYSAIMGSAIRTPLVDDSAYSQAQGIIQYYGKQGYRWNSEKFGEMTLIPRPGLMLVVYRDPVSGSTEIQSGAGAPTQLHRPSSIDIRSYDVRVEEIPEDHRIACNSNINLEITSRHYGEIGFKLHPSLLVESVEDEAGNELVFDQDIENRTLHIRIGGVLGDQLTVTIRYSGQIRAPRSGRAWDQVSSESTYLRPEANWYPRNLGDPNDASSARLTVTVPIGRVVAGSGTLEEAVSIGDFTSYRYVTPNSGLGLAFAAADYVVGTDVSLGSNVKTYLFAEHQALSESIAETVNGIASVFTDRFGPTGFPSLSVAEISDDYRGGHGDLMLVMIYEGAFVDPLNVDLIAHEMAHQWWGHKVGVDFHYGDWLGEGLATYSQMCYLEEMEGEAAFREELLRAAGSYFISPGYGSFQEPILLRARDGTVAYKKGAYFFHMLRFIVGDNVFFNTLKSIVADPPEDGMSPAILQSAFESEAGRSLDSFFSPWLNRRGAPEYELSWEASPVSDGEWEIAGTVTQLNSAYDDLSMPMEIGVKTGDVMELHTIEYTGDRQDFSLVVSAEPDSVQLDPDMWILRLTPRARGLQAIIEHDQLAGQLWAEKDWGGVMEEVDKALLLGPDDYWLGRLLHLKGRALHQLGEPELALDALLTSLPLLPEKDWTTAWTRATLGHVYISLGSLDEARTELLAAIEMNATANSVKFAQDGLGLLADAEPVQRADFDGSGRVDFPDFLVLAAAFGSRVNGERWNPVCDLDSNLSVNFTDFLLFAAAFGN